MSEHNEEKENAVPVTVYTTVFCTYCHGAKNFLDQKGIPYDEVDLTGKNNFRNYLMELTGQRTVPQILIHGEPIGGYTDLLKLDQQGKLQEKLQQPANPE